MHEPLSDGKTIYSGSLGYTIRVWNLENGECVQIFADHSAAVLCMTLSSDGKTMYCGSLDLPFGFGIWKTENSFNPAGHSALVLCMSCQAMENHLFGSFDNTIGVWNLENGNAFKPLPVTPDKSFA
jgi:WD40 repeat protein